MSARLKDNYVKQVVPRLMEERKYPNVMAVPRLKKIVINMGVGEATQNIKILDDAVEELAALAGQKPTITRAQKSIAAFKLRQGMPIGAMVTLRGDRMYEFLDRLVNVALPRVRDFRGVPPNAFTGTPWKSRMRGSATFSSRSRNSYIRSPRSVTATPTAMFSRILKFAIAFFAFVTTGFWPVIVATSAVAVSTARAFSFASPRPMLTVILWTRGTCMTFV